MQRRAVCEAVESLATSSPGLSGKQQQLAVPPKNVHSPGMLQQPYTRLSQNSKDVLRPTLAAERHARRSHPQPRCRAQTRTSRWPPPAAAAHASSPSGQSRSSHIQRRSSSFPAAAAAADALRSQGQPCSSLAQAMSSGPPARAEAAQTWGRFRGRPQAKLYRSWGGVESAVAYAVSAASGRVKARTVVVSSLDCAGAAAATAGR